REMPTFDLVAAKGGPKIKRSEDQTPAPTSGSVACTATPPPPTAAGGQRGPSSLPRGGVRTIGTPTPSGIVLTLSGFATPLSAFIELVQSYTGRPVVNKTDLTGLFDFELKFSLENSAPGALTAAPGGATDPAGPSVFTAIQELGLKLEPSK